MNLFKSPLCYACVILFTLCWDLAQLSELESLTGTDLAPLIFLLTLLISGLLLVLRHDIQTSSISQKLKVSLEVVASVCVLGFAFQFHQLIS
ncbi:MAG: hypothetical protein AAF696_16520 [Bacteroidota bacterium]